MAVEDAVTVAPVGEFALKGIRRPLAGLQCSGGQIHSASCTANLVY